MPIEVVILSPTMANESTQRELGETMNPPLVMTVSANGGSLVFSELDGTPVITLLRPKQIDIGDDVCRVMGVNKTVLAGVDVWSEGFVPFGSAQRGLAVAYALAHLTDGVVIMKGMLSV